MEAIQGRFGEFATAAVYPPVHVVKMIATRLVG
jgi:hypothetical protein